MHIAAYGRGRGGGGRGQCTPTIASQSQYFQYPLGPMISMWMGRVVVGKGNSEKEIVLCQPCPQELPDFVYKRAGGEQNQSREVYEYA